MYKALEDGFFAELQRIEALPLVAMLDATGSTDVRGTLGRQFLDERDFITLLSDAAAGHLELIAKRANAETLRNFGRGMQIFTPLYLANLCTNRCVYCGFSAKREIPRLKLSLEEVEVEAKTIAATGLRKILALTGDAPKVTGAAYLADCIKVLARYFSSVGIEVPSMTVEEYAMQVKAGADSMTMFQETYNKERYEELHPAGPKRDFLFRLDAPERAIMGGMRSVNLGPLLGLDDWRKDVFAVGMHAKWIMDKYPQVEVSISLPRMRPHTEGGEAKFQPVDVDDPTFVQALVALRCFLPQVGITMSSREPAWLRDKLLPLGVTRVSAGVCTAVGGHATYTEHNQEQAAAEVIEAAAGALEGSKPQFDISDDRSVDEMAADLRAIGYQPVFSDWLLQGQGDAELTDALRTSIAARKS